VKNGHLLANCPTPAAVTPARPPAQELFPPHHCFPAGTLAARPISNSNPSSRQLLRASWEGSLTCRGHNDIRFGDTYEALAIPSQKLIIGRVQLYNDGKQPFGLRSTGFKLSGRKGPLQGKLKCPRNTIDAGSYLQVRCLKGRHALQLHSMCSPSRLHCPV
jgi:hypothetical protein